MKLQIVWRNPSQLSKPEHSIQKISNDAFRALYTVIRPDHTQEFELILGTAA